MPDDAISPGRMKALMGKQSAPPSPDGGAAGAGAEAEYDGPMLQDMVSDLRDKILPHADGDKAAKIQQAIDLLEGCLEDEEAEGGAAVDGGGEMSPSEGGAPGGLPNL